MWGRLFVWGGITFGLRVTLVMGTVMRFFVCSCWVWIVGAVFVFFFFMMLFRFRVKELFFGIVVGFVVGEVR